MSQISLPPALWVPSTGSFRVYRGSPAEMVQEMAGGPPRVPTPEALRRLVAGLWGARGVRVDLPWGLPDEDVAAAFVHALLVVGLGRPVPQA